MRLVTFMHDEFQTIGVVIEQQYVADLNGAYAELLRQHGKTTRSACPVAADMLDFLELGEPALEMAKEVVNFAQAQLKTARPETFASWLIPLAAAKLLAPVPNPSKVVAIGQNYRDHCAEQNAPIPERPIIFAKFPTAIIGPGEPITWPPALTAQVDYEAELGVVIGKHAKNVAQAEAFDYVAGYLNGNDVSARDLQFGDRQWVRGKSVDTFCPLGPYLVTKDEIPEPHNLTIRSVLNGVVMQDSNTRNLIFNVPFLIEFITQAFTLLPGDIILTGTPHGVGMFREPKIFLQPGDTITIEVERLGTLTNPVAAGKKN